MAEGSELMKMKTVKSFAAAERLMRRGYAGPILIKLPPNPLTGIVVSVKATPKKRDKS